mgnify:CR=1 FL=1
MFGRKSKTQKENVISAQEETLDMHPVIHVADSIIEYQKQLAEREVESLDEMADIQKAFVLATKENERLKDQVQELSSVFADVGQIATSFDGVKNEIVDSVGEAQQKIDELKNSSTEVCDGLKPDFFLVGETLHGDYNQWMNDSMLHSVTNYECYKGLYSSFNSMNMFEINHSLLRQFGPDNWTLYKGKHLLSFVDNHDVTRVASILSNENHLPLIYALAFGMPGIPCVYYGSEWGAKARKEEGDPALRACFEKPEWNDLTTFISRLAEAKKHSNALNYGDFRSVLLTNRQCIFERKTDSERVLVAINADDQPFMAHFDAGCGTAVDLITGETHDFGGGSELAPYSAAYWKMER